MKATDFSRYLTGFLTKYLPHERGAGRNTISSYRDTFVLFISFIEQKKNIRISKLAIKDINKQTVVEFLDWLQSERKNNNATRNLRLAAIHSFFKYIQYFAPDNLYEYQSILSIRVKKKEKKAINYLTLDGIRVLLNQPDKKSLKGRSGTPLINRTASKATKKYIERAETDIGFIMTAYKLRRLINLIGMKELRVYLAGIFSLLLAKITGFGLFLSHLNQLIERIMYELKITSWNVNHRILIRKTGIRRSF